MKEAIAWHEKKAESHRRTVVMMREAGCKHTDMRGWAEKMRWHFEAARALRKLKSG